MMHEPTKTALRFQKRLADYLKKKTPRASHAPVIEENPVAKVLKDNPRKKKRSAAQIAAFKKMRSALKSKYGTSNIGKISKMKKRPARRQELTANPKLSENRGRGHRYEENEEQEQMALSENPSKKRKRKGKKGKRKAKRRAKRSRRMTPLMAMAMGAGGVKRRRKRKHTKKAKRRSHGKKRSHAKKRRRSRRSTVAKTHIVRLPAAKAAQVQVVEVTRRRRHKRKGGGRRRMMQENPIGLGLVSGHAPVLYENADGAFSMSSIRAYGVAAIAVFIGLTAADVADRLVATRKPKDGTNPYYGKDAAAAYRMKPDAWRLATQLGGAAAGMAGTYFTRGRGLIPWVLGGVAVGFGANGLKMLWDWYAAPAIFKVNAADAGKATFGNRAYPMEQAYIQENVAKLFATRPFIPQLAPGQQTPPVIQSPMGAGGGSIYQLGDANGVGRPGQQARTFVNTGRLGNCTECGGFNGCYSNCETLCPNCAKYNNNTECRHVVQAGEDLSALAAAGGVSIDAISAMNGGGDPSSYWQPGNAVMLPYGVCLVIEKQPPTGVPVTNALPPPGYSGVQPLMPGAGPVPVEVFTDVQPTVPQAAPPAVIAGARSNGNMDDMTRRSLEFSGANRQ